MVGTFQSPGDEMGWSVLPVRDVSVPSLQPGQGSNYQSQAKVSAAWQCHLNTTPAGWRPSSLSLGLGAQKLH